jgi:hypothetical protein
MNSNSIPTIVRRDNMSRMSEELVAALKQRVASNYYDRPEVVEIIARAILHSRGVYVN